MHHLSFASHRRYANVHNGKGSSAARYEIDGHMISFIYPNGQVERASFAIWAKDAGKDTPSEVFIGGSLIKLNLEGG